MQHKAHRSSVTQPSDISAPDSDFHPLLVAGGIVTGVAAAAGIGFILLRRLRRHAHGHSHGHGHRGTPMPWQMGYVIDNALRRWWFQPQKLFRPYAMPGSIVVDVGCGFGVNSIAMSELVGPTGRVYAVDVQKAMVEKTLERYRAAYPDGNNLTPIMCKPDNLMLPVEVKGEKQWCDLAVFFWVAHEVADLSLFLRQLHAVMKDGARLLILESSIHFGEDFLEEEKALVVSPGLLGDEGRGKPGFMFARNVDAPLSHGMMFVKL